MANSLRKNTVKLSFAPGSKTPSYLEVLKFSMENLRIPAAEIHSIYKDENGSQFYIKFVDETTFTEFMAEMDENYVFRYDDKTTAEVTIDQASRIFRYVRIFNLPPEIDDREIQYVLGQYGTIRQHVREKFPNVNIYTGIRGVHMEISKEIPAHMYIGHIRARIFYDGLKNRCFFCKDEGHVKSKCPKLAAISKDSSSSTDNPHSGSPRGRPDKPIIDNSKPLSLTMTPLGQKSGSSVAVNSNSSSSSSASPPSSPASSSSTSSTPSATLDLPSATKQKAVANTSNGSHMKDTNTAPDCGRDESNEHMDDDIAEVDRQTMLKRTKPESSSDDDRSVSEKKQNSKTSTIISQQGWHVVERKGNAKKQRRQSK